MCVFYKYIHIYAEYVGASEMCDIGSNVARWIPKSARENDDSDDGEAAGANDEPRPR